MAGGWQQLPEPFEPAGPVANVIEVQSDFSSPFSRWIFDKAIASIDAPSPGLAVALCAFDSTLFGPDEFSIEQDYASDVPLPGAPWTCDPSQVFISFVDGSTLQPSSGIVDEEP